MTREQRFIRDAEAAYRRLGPLTGAMAAHHAMDGAKIMVVTEDEEREIFIKAAVCRPQFSMLHTEFRWYARNSKESSLCTWSHEGTTWIRGWHTADSPEVAALHSAFALYRS